MMKLGILGAGMIVREFLPWLTGPEQHRLSASSMVCRATPPATTNC